MCASNLAKSNADGGDDDNLRAQFLHQQAYAHHIGHGVQRAHLMKVDVLGRRTMDVRFRLRNAPVDVLGVFSDGFR